MKNKSKIIILVVFAVFSALLLAEHQTHFIRHAIDDALYDNYNHYLPCAKLPSENEVLRILSDHQDTVSAIEALNPGQIGVELSTYPATCPGKADLLIWYAGHQDRTEIEALLSEDLRFYGVPVILQNR